MWKPFSLSRVEIVLVTMLAWSLRRPVAWPQVRDVHGRRAGVSQPWTLLRGVVNSYAGANTPRKDEEHVVDEE